MVSCKWWTCHNQRGQRNLEVSLEGMEKVHDYFDGIAVDSSTPKERNHTFVVAQESDHL